MLLPRRQLYDTNEAYQEAVRLYTLIDQLQKRISELEKIAGTGNTAQTGPAGLSSSVNIPALADPQATAQVYGQGFNPSVTVTAILGGSTGYSFSMSGTTYTMVVSNAATARSAISAAQAQAPGATTVTLAKITPAGANGSLTWSAEGVITAVTLPT